MAEKRAAFILRRRRSLGFSKCRWLRTSLSVPSRSIFFFQAPQRLINGFAFFQSDFGQKLSLPLSHRRAAFMAAARDRPLQCNQPAPFVNAQKPDFQDRVRFKPAKKRAAFV